MKTVTALKAASQWHVYSYLLRVWLQHAVNPTCFLISECITSIGQEEEEERELEKEAEQDVEEYIEGDEEDSDEEEVTNVS